MLCIKLHACMRVCVVHVMYLSKCLNKRSSKSYLLWTKKRSTSWNTSTPYGREGGEGGREGGREGGEGGREGGREEG